MLLGKAAETYNVPKTTIFDQLKKELIKMPKSGRKSLCTHGPATQLVDYIVCSKFSYDLILKKNHQIAYQYAEKNKLQHNFDQVKQEKTSQHISEDT